MKSISYNTGHAELSGTFSPEYPISGRLLYGLYGHPGRTISQAGNLGFPKERTKRRHQLKAEEARIGATHQLLPKIARACACDTGWGRRLFRHQHGRCATYSGDFHCENTSAERRWILASPDRSRIGVSPGNRWLMRVDTARSHTLAR